MNSGHPRGGSLPEVTMMSVIVPSFHRVALVLLLFSLLLSWTTPSRAAVVVKSFDTSAFPVVEATVELTGADGAPLCALEPSDFDVMENAVPVLDLEVENDVTPDGRRRLVLVVSAGLRTAGAVLECTVDRAEQILDLLSPGDEVGLVVVRSCATLDVAPTTDHAEVRTALDALEPDGGAALIDGLYLALQTVCDAGGGNVVAVTDGLELDSDTCPIAPDGSADDILDDDVQELVALGTSCGAELDVVSARDESVGWLRDTVDALGGRAVRCSEATTEDLEDILRTGGLQLCETTIRFTSPSGSGGDPRRSVEVCVPLASAPSCDEFTYAVAGLFLPSDLAGAFEVCQDPAEPIAVGVGVSAGEDEVVSARLELTEVASSGDDELVVDLVADPGDLLFRGTVPAGRLGFDTRYDAVFAATTAGGATLRLPPEGALELCTLPAGDEAIALVLPTVETRPGAEVEVPIELRGLRSSFVVSYSIELDLGDAPVDAVVGSHESTVAGDAQWGPPAASLTDDGRLFVSGAGAAPIATTGVLVRLRLQVGLAGPSGCQPSTIRSATLNEGDPPVVETIDGQICVDTQCVDSSVRLWKSDEPVGGVQVLRTVDGTQVTTTADDGSFSLCVGDDETLELELRGPTDDTVGVSALDASLVLQSTVGLVALPDPDVAIESPCDDDPVQPDLWAADTSGDGTVTAFDASLILQRVVGILDSFPAGAWRFTCSPFLVGGDTAVVEHRAVRVGDVNASWVGDPIPAALSRSGVQRSLHWRPLDDEGLRWALGVDEADAFRSLVFAVEGAPLDVSVRAPGNWSSAVRRDGARLRVAAAGARSLGEGADLLVLEGSEPWCPRNGAVELDGDPATITRQGGARPSTPKSTFDLRIEPEDDGSGLCVRWNLGRATTGRIQVFDVRGRRVTQLPVSGEVGSTRWIGTDADDRRLARGVYFMRLSTDDGSAVVRKVVLVDP